MRSNLFWLSDEQWERIDLLAQSVETDGLNLRPVLGVLRK